MHMWHPSMHAPACNLVMCVFSIQYFPSHLFKHIHLLQYAWNNLRVKCLAQGLVGNGNNCHMCKPTHQYLCMERISVETT